MAKTRVGVLLKEKVGKPSSNQSADLISLAQKYQVWCKKIRSLVVSLERHFQAIGHMQATRTQVRAVYTLFIRANQRLISGLTNDLSHLGPFKPRRRSL
jgi:hypothetical protein